MVSPVVMLLPLILTLLPVAVIGAPYSCASACQTAFEYITFNDTDTSLEYYAGYCTDTLRAQSTYICARTYCSNRDIRAGLDYLNASCQLYGSVSLPPYSIISNITNLEGLPTIDLDTYEMILDVIETVVLADRGLYEASLKTIDTWDFEYSTHHHYGWAMLGFWLVVILIGTGNHIFEIVTSKRTYETVDSESQSSGDRKIDLFTTLRLKTRAYITIPPAIRYHCSQPVGWCTVPTRIQSLTIFAFVVINIVLCCVNYRVFWGNLYWNEPRTQLWRYIADRSGHIAIANIALLFTFGMRNNVLLWLTGWSFSTFNKFHRWVARVAIVEAILHSIGYTIEAVLDGGKAEYLADWAERYWWCGAMAVVMMSFLWATSIYPMRRHFYELFLILHIAFALVFLVGMWYHLEIFEGEYNGYLWACISVWAFDRLMRVARIAVLNSTGYGCKAIATYNQETGVMRLSVPCTNVIKPKPGAHYYLYIFNGLKFWESHPFTLSSWQMAGDCIESKEAPSLMSLPVLTQEDKENQVAVAPASVISTASSGSSSVVDQTTLSFIIRPQDSFTNRLRRSIIAQGDTRHLRMVIEGPYGDSCSLENYQSILFIIGGIGITAALSHLCDLARKVGNKKRQPESIELVWAVRRLDLFEEVYTREISLWLKQLEGSLHLTIHVTGNSGTVEHIKDTVGEKEPPSPMGTDMSSVVKIHSGRPDIGELVMNRVQESMGRKMAILSCGTAQQSDDTRVAVARAMREGDQLVDFLPETFDW